eukprot:3952794-Amphidinium_carterae.1
MQACTTRNEGAIRRKADRAQHRARGEDADADELQPTQKPSATTLHTSNLNNASGFETWRRLHLTYDQGEKAQQLRVLARIMRPTWNNVTQAPGEFIRQFQNWRDEIFNYDSTVQSEIAVFMKMALLMQHIQGDIRSHLLLTKDLAKPNFEDSARKVEEYYCNVYVDNNSGGVSAMKGKYSKGSTIASTILSLYNNYDTDSLTTNKIGEPTALRDRIIPHCGQQHQRYPLQLIN